MRWLIGHPGPHFSVHDVYEGWIDGLKAAGEEVFTFNLGDRISFYDSVLLETGFADADGNVQVKKALDRPQATQLAANGMLAAAYKCWPHVVLAVSAFFTPIDMLDMMRSRGHKIVLVHTESPYQDEEQLQRAAHADVNLVNDPVSLERYSEFGPAAYMPHAYRPSVHYPPRRRRNQWDLSFVGTGFPSRVRFFEDMDLDGLRVRFGGPWLDLPEDSPMRDWTDTSPGNCVDNADAAAIYRRSACGINFYRREAEPWWDQEAVAMGPREVEMAACGLFFLRDPRAEGDKLLHMLPTFDSPGDASEKLRWWLAHPQLRARAAAQAREAVEGRTFDENARNLLGILKAA